MPLFRFHRSGLEESLKTTVIVKDFRHLLEIIANMAPDNAHWGASVEIEPYPSQDHNFDSRIGWYTQLVTANLYEKDKLHPIGYLSEPFEY